MIFYWLKVVVKKTRQNGPENELTVKTLNIGTPRLTTIVVLNIKQFNFTMQECLKKM